MRLRTKRLLITSVGAFLAGVLWFVTVDKSWFIETCPECHWDADVTEYRFLQRAFSRRVRVADASFEYFVTVDLGVPCLHPNKTRWHKHRYWGLCVCASPCINGLYRIGGDGMYESLSPLVRDWRQSHPQLGLRYRQALDENDRDYIREFFRRLHAHEPPPP